MPHEVIMPALGMAQKSGIILAWHKGVGDQVSTGELLMEVETDKATVEVEAQAGGFLSRILAEAGDDIPVGQVIALIGSADEVRSEERQPERDPVEEEEIDEPNRTAEQGKTETAPPAAAEWKPGSRRDRILASPKARRLAAERGLDLARLVTAGRPQPFHVADLQFLEPLRAADGRALRIAARASVEAKALRETLAWLETESECGSVELLAAFASGAFRRVTGRERVAATIRLPRQTDLTFIDADRLGLSELVPVAAAADIIVTDLTSTRFVELTVDVQGVPSFGVAFEGSRVIATLASDPGDLDSSVLIDCLDEFAARLDEPIRHLL